MVFSSRNQSIFIIVERNQKAAWKEAKQTTQLWSDHKPIRATDSSSSIDSSSSTTNTTTTKRRIPIPIRVAAWNRTETKWYTSRITDITDPSNDDIRWRNRSFGPYAANPRRIR